MGLFDFRIKNGVLIKYAGKKENVVIPDTVHTIGSSAFENNNIIKSVVLPDAIKCIDIGAFARAENLEQINFPEGLETISESAFLCCYSLKEVTFPNSLKTIGSQGFQACLSLKTVVFPDNGMTIGYNAFVACKALETVIIPDSVQVTSFAFKSCSNVKLVVSCSTVRELFNCLGPMTITSMEEYMKLQARDNTHDNDYSITNNLVEDISSENVDTDDNSVCSEEFISSDLRLRHFTRADLPLEDKKYIFLHCAAEDCSKAEQVARDILAFENGISYAIWISDNPKAVFIEENRNEIERMSVFAPIVTSNYLAMAESFGINSDGKCSFSLETINKEITTVVPFLLEPDLANGFNKLFGDLQGIDVKNTRLQLNLETHLENILGDAKLNEEILHDGFSREYFLSYRKKDRDDAMRIMRSVHNTEEGYGAAIWFDDFLVPGEDFNDQINVNMMNSDAVILSVTPSILEEGNYVKETEYKNAVAVKEVIPVEAVATDRAKLELDYDGLEPCIDVKDEKLLDERLGKISYNKIGKRYGPHDTYLLARAFLAGFRVEKDTNRGLKLLRESAEQNDVNACLHMGFLYLSGRGVQRNLDETVFWYMKAWDLLKNEYNLTQMYELLFGFDGLVLIMQSLNRIGEANDLCREFLSIINEIDISHIDEETIKLWKARALDYIADIHFDISPSPARLEEALNSAEKMITLMARIYGENYIESKALLGSAYANCAKIHNIKGNERLAEENYEKAVDIFANSGVLDSDPTQEYRKIYAGILGEYGLLQREFAIQQSFSNPSRSIELMQPAKESLSKAYFIELNLAEQNPTINNREGLAIALYNLALVAVEKNSAQEDLQRALDIVQKLKEETKDGSFDAFERDIKHLMKKRRFF